jgi:seryl-tRNA synthetase
MADENEHDENDQGDELEMSPEEANQLLDDPDDEPEPRAKRSRDRDEDDEDGGASKLGDPGKRALEAMKEQRKAAKAEAQKARDDLAKAQAELKKYTDKNKSELQRLIEERDTLKDQLGQVTSKAKRRDIAEDLAPAHATPAQIRLVSKYLTGSSDEELQDSAEELFAQFAPEPKEPAKSRTPSRPKEKLRGGGDPDEDDDETDPRKLAEMIRSSRGIH